jgi:hypothetical protein
MLSSECLIVLSASRLDPFLLNLDLLDLTRGRLEIDLFEHLQILSMGLSRFFVAAHLINAAQTKHYCDLPTRYTLDKFSYVSHSNT